MKLDKTSFKNEIASELEAILSYWKEFSPDREQGGFLGRRDHFNKEVKAANKGIILNTRILWTFSAIGNFQNNRELLEYSDRAFEYLLEYFHDKLNDGVFWELNYKGEAVNTRKQIYAQAFAIYALSEYYLFSGNEKAKDWAVSLFELIENFAKDKEMKGYLEAFQEDWSPISDMRLSEKDRNAAKTMNTHLHILEAYTTLFTITKDERVKKALDDLTDIFLSRFYNSETQHFILFFDEQWNRDGNVISYGHDIEAAWLLIEAAKATGNKELLIKTQALAVTVAETFLKEAYERGAGVVNEKNLDTGEVDTDRHWWPHAEAMVGLDYAFRLTGNPHFQDSVHDIWNFTRENLIDKKNGEWFFRINENNIPYEEEDKLGMWKCPYHNSRACMKLLRY